MTRSSHSPSGGLTVAVDVGGTFTDVVAIDPRTNEITMRKVLTSPGDPSEAVLRGVTLESRERDLPVERFLHGTTIATNSLIEKKGARSALLITEGLRGIIEVQSQLRVARSPYDLRGRRPEALVPERDIFEIGERLDRAGQVVRSLDEEKVEAVAKELVARGIQSVGICFLFSFMNPEHEHRARDLITRHHPSCRILCSADVLPRVREWPRCSTIILSAYLEPIVVEYVEKLQAGLSGMGVAARRAFIMESNGGVIPFEGVTSGGRSVHTLLSGPAATVQAARRVAELTGIRNLVTMDIGGTSCDIAFVQEGVPLEVTGGQVCSYDLHVPMLDIATVGAGGGTIARVADDGRLLVGPESAGSEPGPAAYGRGGTYPTVTDADILLGYLGADSLLGDGEVSLDGGAAREAVRRWVGEPLGLDDVDAASAIVRINAAHMADAIRVEAARKGISLAECTVVASGGAGPLHGALIAGELGIRQVLVPPSAGVFSALGLLCTDIYHDYVQSVLIGLGDVSSEQVWESFRELESRAAAEITAEGFPAEDIVFLHEVDTRYAGQGFEIRVKVANPYSAQVRDQLLEEFHSEHLRMYGHVAEGEAVEIVSYRLRALVPMPQYRPGPATDATSAPGASPVRTRQMMFAEGRTEGSVWRREDVRGAGGVAGPAVIEQHDASVLIPPGWQGRTDEYDNLLVTRQSW